MPWISPTPDVAYSTIQMPYFIAGRSKSSVFVQTYRDGFCLGNTIRMGTAPFSPARFTAGANGSFSEVWPYVVTTLPVQLTSVRVRVGITGTVPANNLVVAVYHTAYDHAFQPFVGGSFNYDLVDFTALTPDATGQIALADLPIVSATDNSGPGSSICGVTQIVQTEIPLSTPVTFASPGPFAAADSAYVGYPATQFTFWEFFIALYIDNGFLPVSNVVVNAGPTSSGLDSFVADTLDFRAIGGTTNAHWYDGGTCVGFSTNSLLMALPDLLLVPASQSGTSILGIGTGLTLPIRRGRSYALVIGD